MPRCTFCDNTGTVMEYRLRWQHLPVEGAPVWRAMRLEHEWPQEHELAKLDPERDINRQVIGGGKDCVCKLRRVAHAQGKSPVRQARDYKMAAAGERE